MCNFWITQSVVIDFFSQYTSYFLPSLHAWKISMWSQTLWISSCGYCVCFHSCESSRAWSWNVVVFPESVRSIQVLILCCVRWVLTESRANFPHYGGKCYRVLCPVLCILQRFSLCSVGMGTIPGPNVNGGDCFNSLGWLMRWPQIVPSHTCTDLHFFEHLRGPFAWLESSLCCFLQCSAPFLQLPWLLGFLVLSSRLRENAGLCLGPFLCHGRKPLESVWGSRRSHFAYFLSPWDQCPLLPDVQCLENGYFPYVVQIFSSSKQEGMSSRCYSILARKRSPAKYPSTRVWMTTVRQSFFEVQMVSHGKSG